MDNISFENQKSSPKSKIATRFLSDAFSQDARDPVSFLTTLIRESTNLKASDILMEPQRNEVRIRARIDGVLYELGKVPLESYDGIASRVKVLANLDPTEKRRIQEGQFTLEHEKRTIAEQKNPLNVYLRKDADCGDGIVDPYESCEIGQPNCTDYCELTTGAYWKSSK